MATPAAKRPRLVLSGAKKEICLFEQENAKASNDYIQAHFMGRLVCQPLAIFGENGTDGWPKITVIHLAESVYQSTKH